MPIELPEGTAAKLEDGFIVIKSSKGELKQQIHELIKVEIKEKEVVVSVANPEVKNERALWGLYRSLINNMVIEL